MQIKNGQAAVLSLKEMDLSLKTKLTNVARSLLLAVSAGLISAKAADKTPNIVFILMDNLGYGEVGCYGGGILPGAPTAPTSRIDRL